MGSVEVGAPVMADNWKTTESVPKGTMPARVLMLPISGYRRFVSPMLGARCRFAPSCSEYALGALAEHGAVRGLLLAVTRLARCHPFNPGGYDPVPTRGANR